MARMAVTGHGRPAATARSQPTWSGVALFADRVVRAGATLVEREKPEERRELITCQSTTLDNIPRRDVEIRYGKDVIIVTRVTSEQQEKLIDAWIDRHSRS